MTGVEVVAGGDVAQRHIEMGMHVDPAGQHELTGGIDHVCG